MDSIKKAWDFLKGKKSYIIAAGTLAYAGYGFYSGHMTKDEAIKLAIGSGALATLRHGLDTKFAAQP